MKTKTDKLIDVAVGLIVDAEKGVLVCQRPAHKSYPLKWEFPGGKVEPGEDAEQALRRELHEELGIAAAIGALCHQQHARYSDGRIYAVRYFIVDTWHGEITNREFAAVAWVLPQNIGEFDILEGNREICARITELGFEVTTRNS